MTVSPRTTLVTPSGDPDRSSEDPLPVIPLDEEPLEPAPVSPRFCRSCGDRFEPAQADCRRCRITAAQRAVLQETTGEQRAIRSAITLYFALLLVCMVGLVCGMVGGRSAELDVLFGQLLAISAVTLAGCVIARREVVPTLTCCARPQWFLIALPLACITYGVATGTIGLATQWMQLPMDTMSRPFRHAGYGLGMIVLCVCVQPAVFEELAFRGVILGALRKALRPGEAVMVSALMFMILHLSVLRFPHTLALGLSAGFLRTRTRSIYPCMLLHFTHNFLCVLSENHWHLG